MDNNKPKLLIHIGYHKTATTFFQKQLFSNKQFNLLDRLEIQKQLLQPSPYSFDKNRFNLWLKKRLVTNKLNIISEEEISGNIHTSGNGRSITYEMAERLSTINVADVHILIMLREQCSMVESCYRQYIKKGGTFSFNNYLYSEKNGSQRFRFQGFSLEHLKYDNVVRHYQNNFGVERTHCFLYEEFIADKKLFLSLLKPLLDTKQDISEIILEKIANPSLSNLSIFFAKITNRFTVCDPISRGRIFYIPLLNKIFMKIYMLIDRSLPRTLIYKKYLSHQLEKEIENYFVESNERLFSDTGLNLKRYGYAMNDSLPPMIENDV